MIGANFSITGWSRRTRFVGMERGLRGGNLGRMNAEIVEAFLRGWI
jgi:hypothetical protein